MMRAGDKPPQGGAPAKTEECASTRQAGMAGARPIPCQAEASLRAGTRLTGLS